MLGLPSVASAHGHEVDTLILVVHLLMLVLFIGWGIFFVYVLMRFRKKTNPQGNYHGLESHASSVVELAVVVAEVVLLFGFSIPFWAKQVNALPNRPDTVEVRVVAEQFAWNVHYPGKDGIFGKTDVKFVDNQTNPMGIDLSDPHSKDDITTVNQLHLPVGRPAMVHLSSKDVIHAFSLNAMRVKQDVIPGLSIPTWFVPTQTGDYEIGCAQLCGIGHYRMKGFMKIHSQESFDQWLSGQTTLGGGSDEGDEDSFWN